MRLRPEAGQRLSAVPDKVGAQAWDQKTMGIIGIVQPTGDERGQHTGIKIQECCEKAELYAPP